MMVEYPSPSGESCYVLPTIATESDLVPYAFKLIQQAGGGVALLPLEFCPIGSENGHEVQARFTILKTSKSFLSSVGKILLEAGATNEIGIVLRHKRFPMQKDGVLLSEFSDQESRICEVVEFGQPPTHQELLAKFNSANHDEGPTLWQGNAVLCRCKAKCESKAEFDDAIAASSPSPSSTVTSPTRQKIKTESVAEFDEQSIASELLPQSSATTSPRTRKKIKTEPKEWTLAATSSANPMNLKLKRNATIHPKKYQRFEEWEADALRKEYSINQYPSKDDYCRLATLTGRKVESIKNWFNSRRSPRVRIHVNDTVEGIVSKVTSAASRGAISEVESACSPIDAHHDAVARRTTNQDKAGNLHLTSDNSRAEEHSPRSNSASSSVIVVDDAINFEEPSTSLQQTSFSRGASSSIGGPTLLQQNSALAAPGVVPAIPWMLQQPPMPPAFFVFQPNPFTLPPLPIQNINNIPSFCYVRRF